jgi:hypothetical protein
MQSQLRRYAILIGALLVGAALAAVLGTAPPPSAARWPADTATYDVEGWTVGPLNAFARNDIHYAERMYQRTDGLLTAEFSLATSPEAKVIDRTGPDVPFLGSGYSVEDAQLPLMMQPNTGALIVRHDSARWLALHAYGERRGLLGNGIAGWSMVALDAVLGLSNDYYKLYVVAPIDNVDSAASHDTMLLAETLFTRVANWYATDKPS